MGCRLGSPRSFVSYVACALGDGVIQSTYTLAELDHGISSCVGKCILLEFVRLKLLFC